MRAQISRVHPMLAAAIMFALFACVDRSDPTAPGTPNASDDVSVVVRLPESSVEVGHDVDAVATATNSAGKPIHLDSIEWSSSDSSVAVVSSAGRVSARKMGSAAVFAKWHKHSGKGALSVTDTVPAKVIVSPSVASAAVGGQTQLTASVATQTGRQLPGHLVKWTSTDTRYVTVSQTGVTTGARAGSAHVIAQASSVADTAVVSVSPASIASFSVTPGTSTVASGQTLQLTAHAADADGNQLTGRAVAWESSDESIASVSTGGVVTAGKVGNATITATSEGMRANATIHVMAGGAATITITPGSIGLVAGKTQQLSASLADDAGNPLPASSVTWSTSNSSIATVSSSGLVTAVLAGSATITAAADGQTGRASVVVSAGAVQTIAINPASLSLVAGNTRQLVATLTDASGNTLTGQAVAWSSSNSTVAIVSSSGLVTASHSGNATITAAAGGANGTASLTVVAGSISSVVVSPGSASLVAGATQQLAAKLQDNSGSPITGQSVTWSTSDASIVQVSSSGLTTAAHAGRATVTASAGGKSGSAAFSVAAGPVNSVSITPASGSLQQGKTLQLAATYQDVAGNVVTAQSVAWTSSASSIAAVSSSGLVTGVAVGNANVTVTADGESKSAAITVTAASAPPPPAPAPAPPPPPPPPPTAPPPPPLQTACSDIAHSRVVSVSSSAELHSALSGARPGDLIQMADGTYGDGHEFKVTVAGTQAQPIALCGSANAVINGGTLTNITGVRATGANYWTFSGFTITNALFGFFGDGSSHMVLEGLTIHAIGQEAMEIAAFSKYNVIRGNRIYDTGRTVAEYGEGIYIGSSYDKWCNLTGCAPDASDSTLIEGNTIGPDVRAEHVDVKEGSTGGEIRNNTFDGRGLIESQNGWPTSWVIIQGNGYHIDNNTGTNTIASGYRVIVHYQGNGMDNIFSGNTANVGGASYGFAIETPASNDNVVRCNNVVVGASRGFANVACQ